MLKLMNSPRSRAAGYQQPTAVRHIVIPAKAQLSWAFAVNRLMLRIGRPIVAELRRNLVYIILLNFNADKFKFSHCLIAALTKRCET